MDLEEFHKLRIVFLHKIKKYLMGIKINDHGFIYAVHMLEKKLKQTEKQPLTLNQHKFQPYTFITLSLPEVINK